MYEALKPASHWDGEFHLLNLFPGRKDSHIHCAPQIVPLNAPPLYEALSYTWSIPKGVDSTIPVASDRNSTHAIPLNGCLAMVTYNLEVALQQLRHAERERILWVDALCINQENDLEKSEQVRPMGRIYK